MDKEELQRALAVLGTEGILDTLLCVKEMGWATASEVAERMNVHVATAVKRLSSLEEIGALEQRVRRGRTRSAKEYSLTKNSISIGIDLEVLAGTDGKDNSELYSELLEDMAGRFGRFSGKGIETIHEEWVARLEDPKKILSGKSDNPGPEEMLDLIAGIVEIESNEYGMMTVRSLLAASLDSVGASAAERNEIMKKIGVIR